LPRASCAVSKFITDEWMVGHSLEPPSLLTRSSELLGLLERSSSCATRGNEWWANKTVVDLHLPSPITVPPSMPCGAAVEIMSEHGIDQLPVVDDTHGVVGVVTLGHLSSKILGQAASAGDPCSTLMFAQFAQVPLATPLSAFSRIFERHAFCIIVTPMRHLAHLTNPRNYQIYSLNNLTSASSPKKVKHLVVAVCTQVDLLKFVMMGEKEADAMAPRGVTAVGTSPSILPPPSPTNRADELSRGTNELDCAQLAWQFMKPPTQPRSRPTSPTNRADELSRGTNELDCAQLAWQFMKPLPVQPRSPPQSPIKRADELTRGSNELNCSQLAWQFMKPPVQPRVPSQSPTKRADELSCGTSELNCAQLAWQFMKPLPVQPRSPPQLSIKRADELARGSNELNCSQLAWQFMKPPASPTRSTEASDWQTANRHFASPMLNSQSVESLPPKLDLTVTTLSDDQPSADDPSGQPTRFSTPKVTAVTTSKTAVESLKL